MPDVKTPMTPLRSLATTDDGGVRVIRDTGAAWLDGSEQVLLDRMRSGLALDSLSDELFATATNWPERYHLSPSRANVIRSLDLPSDAAVLEIGAGCGAITRYLGETCATVDALEPTLARARVAAARSADLPGVAVFSGEVSDIPLQPAYDVVVVVGVLEYVGGGSAIRGPYITFLELLRQTLRPGGQLVVAIENALGVKYLAGAPEDHSGEVFHSVEGYPKDGPARTFNRRQLVGLAQDAGFVSTYVLGAFPDYKLTRLVYADRLLERAPSLALEVPRFPSPDWVIDRPVLLDEELLWTQLVDAGVGAEFSNSFVLVAQAEGTPRQLWPDGRLASYFSMRRRRPFQVRKTIDTAAGRTLVTSALLGSGSADGLRVIPYVEEWVEGTSLVALAVDEPEILPTLVRDWVRLLKERVGSSDEGTPFDVLPHNVHYVNGEPRLIDDEWRSELISVEQTMIRGSLLLARDLTSRSELSRWGVDSVSQLAQRIAQMVGALLGETSIDVALGDEAQLQALVGGGRPGTAAYDTTRADVTEQLRRVFVERRAEMAPVKAWIGEKQMERDAVVARDQLFETGRQLGVARSERDAARVEFDAAQAQLELTERALHAARAERDAARSEVLSLPVLVERAGRRGVRRAWRAIARRRIGRPD
ncbi:methyltransferase [Cellulomonas sp. WB94]|uniref:methyltransferase n=1 Tax=Cellulomonas sp. WB94 TaxID=2173174 RepID=UPI001304DC79|nr:methyltransferase [Cellulomonas sp. WB94]